jgi:hypothetical protein
MRFKEERQVFWLSLDELKWPYYLRELSFPSPLRDLTLFEEDMCKGVAEHAVRAQAARAKRQ